MPKTMTLIPKISEKALGRTTKDKLYVFMVPKSANKDVIRQAVEAQFEVSVKAVRTATLKGKTKTSVRRRLQPLTGKRSDVKKAYITLLKGSIPMLEETSDGN